VRETLLARSPNDRLPGHAELARRVQLNRPNGGAASNHDSAAMSPTGPSNRFAAFGNGTVIANPARMMTRATVHLLRTSFVAVIVVVGAATPAFPQPVPPPPPSAYSPPPANPPQPSGILRSGFIGGFSVGGGAMGGCSDCDAIGGLAVALHVGGMLSPRLALMFDGGGIFRPVDGGSVFHSIDTLAAQYWPTGNFWVKGGLGTGVLRLADNHGVVVSDAGFAMLGAIGIEIAQGRRFALDLQATLAAAFYSDGKLMNGTIGIGFNWY
jgi:hypothetical protein